MVIGFCFPFCSVCCLTGRAGLGRLSARGRQGMGHESPYPFVRPVARQWARCRHLQYGSARIAKVGVKTLTRKSGQADE